MRIESMSGVDPWQQEAACLDIPWDITQLENEERGKALCRGCSVLAPCNNYALHDDRAIGVPGVLGGLTAQERGQVACEGCQVVVLKRGTRAGLCWACYTHRRRG